MRGVAKFFGSVRIDYGRARDRRDAFLRPSHISDGLGRRLLDRERFPRVEKGFSEETRPFEARISLPPIEWPYFRLR